MVLNYSVYNNLLAAVENCSSVSEVSCCCNKYLQIRIDFAIRQQAQTRILRNMKKSQDFFEQTVNRNMGVKDCPRAL